MLRRFRTECLDCHRIASLEEARRTIEAWRVADYTDRPNGHWDRKLRRPG
jgi:hypothetical protein